VGVSLAAKGIFLDETRALFTGTKILLFEFWRYMVEFRRHIFELWRKIFEFWSQSLKNSSGGGGGGWVPQDLGALFRLGVVRQSCAILL